MTQLYYQLLQLIANRRPKPPPPAPQITNKIDIKLILKNISKRDGSNLFAL